MIKIRKAPEPAHNERDRQMAYDRLAFMAGTQAIRRGILERDSAVLDVGCKSPRVGLYRTLTRSINWKGQYCGIGPMPKEHADTWNRMHRLDPAGNPISLIPMSLELTREQVLSGHGLPFPPTALHPFKEIAVAFCIDSLRSVQNKSALMMDLKCVAAQVVVVGAGLSETLLDEWEFQFIASLDETEAQWIGVWMDDRALRRWRIKNAHPATRIAYFDSNGDGVVGKRVGVCRKCGETYIPHGIKRPGRSRFVCAKCSTENAIRHMANGTLKHA